MKRNTESDIVPVEELLETQRKTEEKFVLVVGIKKRLKKMVVVVAAYS